MNEIENFYKILLGNAFKPYNFQIKVAKLLLSGKNIILSVPTGAGKTWASIIPFLIAKQNKNKNFPQKLIYSLPLRTLTNSIHQDVNNILDKKMDFKNLSAIQTGEYNNDKYFEKDIIFSTIDQTLSSFLSFPLALSKRQANINAGAIIGSYLVFDEFHLLDPQLSMSTTLGMLQMLSNLTRFCIMTATMSDEFTNFIKNDAHLNNIEVVTLKDFPEDIQNIKSLKESGLTVKKTVHVYKNTINSENVVKQHKSRTIVICNRVETTQKLFLEIEKIKSPETNLFCIHSRFFDKDREEKEKIVKEYFGKDSNKNAILISTQVIEAGMDISCEILHTEISPVNSFLQRSGRCARFENEIGQIFVYDVLSVEEKEISEDLAKKDIDKKEIKKINNKYLPYNAELCKKTFKILKTTPNINEKISKYLVNKVMTPQEKVDTENISANLFNKEKIKTSWQNCDKSNYRNTIRDIESVNLVIINGDYSELKEIERNPYAYESIGLYKWTFVSKWEKITNNKLESQKYFDREETLVWHLEYDDMFCDKESNEKYILKSVNLEDNSNDRYYVNSGFFNYDNSIGLNFVGIGNRVSEQLNTKEKSEDYSPLKSDTFTEHNNALLEYYSNILKPKMNFTFNHLSQFLVTDQEFDFDRVIRLMLVMHDYGKLNKDWQEPIIKYQSVKSGILIEGPLAHSDFDRNNANDIELSKKCGMHNRPEHSAIGAFALKRILLAKGYQDWIVDPICSAVSKHHNAEVKIKKIKGYSILKNNYQSIKKSLNKINIDEEPLASLSEKEISFELYQEQNKNNSIILEFVLSRILRICDQKATKNININK